MQCGEIIGAAAETEAPLTAEQQAWLLQLEEAKRLVEALPVVKSVELFFDDDDTNLNKVEATLWCCWSTNRLKRVKVACDKSGNKPTHLEAMRALHASIEKDHMCADHQHNPRAVAITFIRKMPFSELRGVTVKGAQRARASLKRSLTHAARS